MKGKYFSPSLFVLSYTRDATVSFIISKRVCQLFGTNKALPFLSINKLTTAAKHETASNPIKKTLVKDKSKRNKLSGKIAIIWNCSRGVNNIFKNKFKRKVNELPIAEIYLLD